MKPSKDDPKKYQSITADLLKKIRSGELSPGDRILAERPLAEQYGVARLTARRALSDLEERGLVKRDGRRGTIVVNLPDASKAQTLTLICSASPGTIIEEAIMSAMRKANELKWGIRVIRVLQNDDKPILEAIKLGNPTLVLGWPRDISPSGKLEKAIRRSGSHVAILAGSVENCDIPTITCDDQEGMLLAIKALQDAGHARIALVTTSADPTHPIASMQMKTWWEMMRPTMTSQELNNNLVVIGSVYAENGLFTMFNRLSEYLASPASAKITALLCLTEELATAAIAACRACGRTVPERMSVMEYGWSQRSEYYNPPRTGIYTHIDKHIDLAIDLLVQIRKGNQPSQLRHYVKPELIVRETVAEPWRG